MRINYNVTGADRKALVRAMVELLGEPPVYQGAPSFAYAVGSYIVDKDGVALRQGDPDLLWRQYVHQLAVLGDQVDAFRQFPLIADRGGTPDAIR